MRQLTVGEFLDAVDKNGYNWGRNRLWNKDDNSACIIGQALLNLGYTKEDLIIADTDNVAKPIGSRLNRAVSEIYAGDGLISYNDAYAMSYDDVRNYAHRKLDLIRDQVIEFEDGK